MGPVVAGSTWVRRSSNKRPFPLRIPKNPFGSNADKQVQIVVTSDSFARAWSIQGRNALHCHADHVLLFCADIARIFGSRPGVSKEWLPNLHDGRCHRLEWVNKLV